MIKKITNLMMFIVALFFMNQNVSAQSGDFQFLFDTDGDAEGFVSWGGSVSVANGVLTLAYNSGDSNNGIQANPPAATQYLNKGTHPIMAIKLSAAPSRMDAFVNLGWWKETTTKSYAVDADFNDEFIYYWNFTDDWDKPIKQFADGNVELARIIIKILGNGVADETVDISWIKSFASVTDLASYAGVTLAINDVASISKTKVVSGLDKIEIKNCELNASVEVFDITGRLVRTAKAVSSNLSLSLDVKGIYIVKISGQKSIIAKKAIAY
jgi:hypothetical protein